MLKNVRKKINEGFTLIEILIVVVIIGILSAIAVPAYFDYVKRGYASDAKVQMKTILENSKLFYSENAEFPTTVDQLNADGYANIPKSTTDKWTFDIALEEDPTSGYTGKISAESKALMPGGAGELIEYDVEQGKFFGYGCKDDIGGGGE